MKRHKVLKPSGKRLLVPYLLSGSVILLILIQIVLSNHLALAGRDIKLIETQIQDLTQENTELSEKVASDSALLTINAKAQNLGFVKTIKPLYLSETQAMAHETH